jgi:hypothetical protein
LAIWLYTLTRKEGVAGFFELRDGGKIDATSDNFVQIVSDGRLKEITWWGVEKLYHSISTGDEIYINGTGYGLIGYAVNATVLSPETAGVNCPQSGE